MRQAAATSVRVGMSAHLPKLWVASSTVAGSGTSLFPEILNAPQSSLATVPSHIRAASLSANGGASVGVASRFGGWMIPGTTRSILTLARPRLPLLPAPGGTIP